MEELCDMSQGKDETISKFLSNFKYIAGYFKRPPPSRTLLELAGRKLMPDYRRYVRNFPIESIEDLETLGRPFERQKEWDNRYAPPLSR